MQRYSTTVALLLAIATAGGIFFYFSQTTVKKDLYILPKAERNILLVQMNNEREYQAVIDITNEGIQKHKSLVWEDTDFWNHRGFAFYKLGNCIESAAAFGHVVLQDLDNEIATSFLAEIGADPRCSNTSQALLP